ncbi:MAG: hypothetical protein IJC52_01100, partial [Clostridia bacterium]|nr:hypothetical protein [Clostridia bacterium]
CGGRRICLAPWLAVLLTVIFIAVLLGRCHTVRTCATTTVSDVSRETSEIFCLVRRPDPHREKPSP